MLKDTDQATSPRAPTYSHHFQPKAGFYLEEVLKVRNDIFTANPQEHQDDLSLPSGDLSPYTVNNRGRQEYEMRSTRQCALRKSHKFRHFMTALFQSFLSISFNYVTDTIK